MATSRRGPDTGTEDDGTPDTTPEETSDVLRVETTEAEGSSESDGSDWPKNRPDGNPFSYGGKKS